MNMQSTCVAALVTFSSDEKRSDVCVIRSNETGLFPDIVCVCVRACVCFHYVYASLLCRSMCHNREICIRSDYECFIRNL